jgi:hypothetical protein
MATMHAQDLHVGYGYSYTLSQYQSWNHKVACAPWPTTQVAPEKNGGFIVAKQKKDLTGLKVVFGADKIAAGATVYVRGDLCFDPEAKKIHSVDGKEFVLIPENEIVIVKFYDELKSPDFGFPLVGEGVKGENE